MIGSGIDRYLSNINKRNFKVSKILIFDYIIKFLIFSQINHLFLEKINISSSFFNRFRSFEKNTYMLLSHKVDYCLLKLKINFKYLKILIFEIDLIFLIISPLKNTVLR